jgi:lipoprotein-anchoring transpeptidase ErfK/SrfK
MKKILLSAFLALSIASPVSAGDISLRVSLSKQQLSVLRAGRVVRTYPVSTSKYGTGSRQLSNQTPLGRHAVAKKIGAGRPPLTVFKNRVASGRLNRVNLTREPVKQDLITSRILWLRGLEPGVNSGRGVDSFHRFIYIHGTADEGLIGTPASHGCIRMKNADVIEVFDLVETGTPVLIEA